MSAPETDDLLIEQLKAAAHPLRFRILDLLRGGERNVGEIEEVSGIAQPGLSQQLGVLRKAGLVETRKDAKLVFYSLDSRAMARLAECFAQLGGLAAAGAAARPRQPSPGAANFARLS